MKRFIRVQVRFDTLLPITAISTVFEFVDKSNLLFYSLYYAEACNEFAGPIFASLRLGNTAPFEEMLQRWRAVGNTVSDLTSPRFEPQTYCSTDKRVTA